MEKSKWPRIRWNQANAELANRPFENLFDQPAECPHAHLSMESWGSLRTWGGDLIDDIETAVVCLDCGEYVPEAETSGEFEEIPI